MVDERYEGYEKEEIVALCRLKDSTNKLLLKRIQDARAVIDMLAIEVGVDPESYGLTLYSPDENGSSPLVPFVKGFSRRGTVSADFEQRLLRLEREISAVRASLQGGEGL